MSRKNSFTKEDLINSSLGKLFGMDKGKLPAPPMLMMDRITHISDEGGKYGNGEIIAELDVTEDLWVFHCPFKGDPVMPGCLGLDALWQLIGYLLVYINTYTDYFKIARGAGDQLLTILK